MSTTYDSTMGRFSRWSAQRARIALAVAALVFVALWAAGAVTAWPALAGFAAIATVLLIPAAASKTPSGSLAKGEELARGGDRLIDAVLAALPDPVIALDRSSEVVAFNARAATVAPALRRGEPVSLGLRVPQVIEAIRRAAANGGPQRVEFFERVPVVRWYEAIITPIEAADIAASPETPGPLVLMTLHDLTPLRRVEEMRADFIANASHELRTPLAALSGFIETLQGPAREDAAARERFLPIMADQAKRMARLIDDLLSLSRIELNAHLRPDSQVDLVPLIRQVIDGLQTLARDRDVEVRVTAPAQPLLVLGDRDELLRVFENLIENALKYAAAGKRVDISLSTTTDSSNEACVAVRDYGPGIAPEHLPRLTERFYRVDVADSRAQGGTGLGLALVKHILNRHGGRLAIESVPGQGACFNALLPLAGTRPGENIKH
jgi:two-component system, OmpR family, phosphate regulon sensor histidine kinase PhoR